MHHENPAPNNIPRKIKPHEGQDRGLRTVGNSWGLGVGGLKRNHVHYCKSKLVGVGGCFHSGAFDRIGCVADDLEGDGVSGRVVELDGRLFAGGQREEFRFVGT